MSGYTLAVDYGTTFTVGVVVVNGTVEVLEFDHSRYLPSLVWLNEDNELVVGRAALNQAALRPERLAPTPKREIGKPALLLGGEAVPLAGAVGAVLARVGEEAARRFDGVGPTRLVLTHPAAWAEERLAVLRAAAAEAGLPDPTLVPEPVAAAAHYADGTLSPGAHVAVYDLGGGTFDVAVLRRGETGFEVAGAPGGDPHLGGEDFDDQLRELVEAHAADLDPAGYTEAQEAAGWAARKERVAFRREVREAKEALSDDLSCLLSVPGVEEPVRVTRAELHALIEADLGRTVALLRQSIAQADLAPADLAAVYLTGGSSRIPLVSTLVAEALGVMPTTQGDPKAVVALGAVRALEGAGRRAGAKSETKEQPPLRVAVTQADIDAGRTVDVAVEGRTEPLKVKLPPLLRSGQKLRLAGRGPEGEDLFVEVSVIDLTDLFFWRGAESKAGEPSDAEDEEWAKQGSFCSLTGSSELRTGLFGVDVILAVSTKRIQLRPQKWRSGARLRSKAGIEVEKFHVPLSSVTAVTLQNRSVNIRYGGNHLNLTFVNDEGRAREAVDAIKRAQSGKVTSAGDASTPRRMEPGKPPPEHGLETRGRSARENSRPQPRRESPASPPSSEIELFSLRPWYRITTKRIVVRRALGGLKCDEPVESITSFGGAGTGVRVSFADGRTVKADVGLMYKERFLAAIEQATGMSRQR